MSAINHFVFLCQKIARAHLLIKSRGKYPLAYIFGLSMDDIALDSTAELFQRNENGVFVQIRSYFTSVDLNGLSNQALLAHLRRLVTAKVNYHLMALRRDHDPSFWKVLRNIKLATETLGIFNVVERLGDSMIVPVTTDPLVHKPMMEQDEIERVLNSVARNDENIPMLLSHLSRFLQNQEEYSRILRLLSVTAAIRSFYIRKHLGMTRNQENPDTTVEIRDALNIIQEQCSRVKGKMESRYIVQKGIRQEIFDGYFFCIEEYLASKLISGDGSDKTLFEYLKTRQPDLTKEVYTTEHKAIFEYLLSLTEKEAVEELKKQFI